MQRREFLRLGALGFMLTPLAACMPPGGDHATHNAVAAAGLSPDGLPSGQPLAVLPRLNNQVSAPDFKTDLRIAPTRVPLLDNQKTELWLYNNKLAPVIEVTEGGQVEVAVDNHLDQPTTIHWHGVKVPADQDGGPHDLIPAHGSKTYAFTVPEGNAGLHWFHPHPHDYLAEQIAHSLAGVFLVKPKEDPVPAEIQSHLLVVTDLRLDEQAQVAPHTPVDWMNGREGNLLLVNGQRNPELQVAPGETFRLRMVNACAGRYLRLNLEDHGLQLIGTDGGYLEDPVALDELLLVPGQRCDLLVRASERKERRFGFLNLPYDRDWMGPEPAHYRQTETLLTLVTDGSSTRSAVRLPTQLREIQPLGQAQVTRQIELTEEMPHGDHGGSEGHGDHGDHGGSGGHGDHGGHGQHGHSGRSGMRAGGRPPIDFLINGKAFKMGEIMFEGKKDQVEEWEVFNNSHMDHPFHVHGTHFQVVSIQDQGGMWRSPDYRAWRDTVNLKPRQKMKLKMVFEEPGEWMFHCHIIEHEELGMMASILIR